MKGEAGRWHERWAGRTVACIASGPSLTPEDCETIRQAGLPTIVTNTTFRLCPWADVLFGFDGKWWREYKDETAEKFAGERVTCSVLGHSAGITSFYQAHWFSGFGNSGTAAISLAVFGGASKVVLLGYDCQKTNGKAHWHPDHPPGLGNAKSMPNWPRKFEQVAKFAKTKGVQVVNCSKATALTCFSRGLLEEQI